jgi:hypothetical protein
MCPGVIIPPLPKKDFFGRFSEEFVQSRIRGLEAFLHRVTRHPLLLSQPFVRSFLETQDIKVSYANLKSMKESKQVPSAGISSWLETKVGEISVSKQEVKNSSPQLAKTDQSRRFGCQLVKPPSLRVASRQSKTQSPSLWLEFTVSTKPPQTSSSAIPIMSDSWRLTVLLAIL